MKRVVLVLLLLGAAQHKAESPFIAKAKAAVADSLKDPMSAQFRDIHTVAGERGATIVCGEVNAKNSYAGYVGFRRFAYNSSFGDAIVNDDYHAMWDVYSAGCWPSG